MSVIYNPENGQYSLHTKNYSYIMLEREGFLLHLYWGKKMRGNCDYIFRHDVIKAAFSPMTETGDGFILDDIPMEYPCWGRADMRTPALEITNSDGSVIVDPSAASFIECIRRDGRFRVIPAKNDVIDGIRRVSDCLKDGTIKFSPSCRDSIREFGLYRWEENSAKDSVRKENDHAMDDMRYFVSTVLKAKEEGFTACVVERRRK